VAPTACAEKVKEAGERLTNGATTPVPVRLTVWVAGLALSAMVTAPVLAPTAVGLKVTLRVQLAPAATLAPQVLVWEKSPLAVMLVTLRATFPVLLSVTVCALLLVPTACAGKVREAGERLTRGAVPVPVRLTVCVAGLALSVMVKVAVSEPARVGVKVTLRVQLAPAVSLEPQLLVWAKSLLFVPAMVTPVTLSVVLPVFNSVTVCAALVVLSTWLPNERVVGDRLATAPTPVPVSITVCGLIVALSVMVSAPDLVPGAVGVNVTLTEQVPLAGIGEEDTQVSLSAKSPEATTSVTTSPAAPTLVRVAVCGALVVPITWLANLYDEGKMLREGDGTRLTMATKAS
jgi:hypothetical protein